MTSTFERRLAAVESQIGREVAFVPRHIPIFSSTDPRLAEFLAVADPDPTSRKIRAIVLVPLTPEPSRSAGFDA